MCCNNSTLQQLYILFLRNQNVYLLITTSRSRFPVILYYGTQTIPQHQASAAILLQSNFLNLNTARAGVLVFRGTYLTQVERTFWVFSSL